MKDIACSLFRVAGRVVILASLVMACAPPMVVEAKRSTGARIQKGGLKETTSPQDVRTGQAPKETSDGTAEYPGLPPGKSPDDTSDRPTRREEPPMSTSEMDTRAPWQTQQEGQAPDLPRGNESSEIGDRNEDPPARSAPPDESGDSGGEGSSEFGDG